MTLFVSVSRMLFNAGTPELVRFSILVAITIATLAAAFFIFALTVAARAQQKQPITGTQRLVGQIGTVRAAFTAEGRLYSGSVLLRGELWQATASQPISFGADVSVTQVQGIKLRVKPATTAVSEQLPP